MIVHGVAWSGSIRIRNRSERAVNASTTGPITSESQRSSTVDRYVDEALMTGLVGCLDVQHEQIAIFE